MTSRINRLASILLLSLGLNACSTAHYPVNERLTSDRGANGYALRNLESKNNSDSLLIMLSISGGGYRAAALGYGVLKALRDTQLDWEGQHTTMLDELDFISSVSGGSLLAAYYAANGDKTFDHFETDVLGYDLQTALWRRGLSLSGLWQQTSNRFGRADMLAEVLDEHIFHGQTYGDLPRKRPLAYINATDMAYGGRFEFTQDQFDYLCSDLNRFPLSRAVAASMAVPVLLSPISLWNYAAACPVPTSLMAFQGMANRGEYVHLLDGGLADNSGVQTPLEIINSRGGIVEAARLAGYGAFDIVFSSS